MQTHWSCIGTLKIQAKKAVLLKFLGALVCQGCLGPSLTLD